MVNGGPICFRSHMARHTYGATGDSKKEGRKRAGVADDGYCRRTFANDTKFPQYSYVYVATLL